MGGGHALDGREPVGMYSTPDAKVVLAQMVRTAHSHPRRLPPPLSCSV